MKKPPTKNSVHLGLQIPADMMASIDRAARKKGCNRSELVREYLAKALARVRI